MSLRQDAQVIMMYASLKVESEVDLVNLPVVCELPNVFPNDIGDLPPDRKVEFALDLVHGTRSISMSPYRMFASELGELKKNLEDMLEKKFIRHNV